MKLRRWSKRLLWTLIVIVLLVLVLIFAGLSSARRVTTASGVDMSLRIPLPSKKASAIVFPNYAATGENVFIKGFLAGPVVRHDTKDHWSATWFCEDKAEHASGSGTTLAIDCAGKRHTFALGKAPIPRAVAPMPDKLVVLSDVEGNSRFLEDALRTLGVTDDTGRWQYGHGQLVVLGDSVDRGRDVFAVLWRLHDLSMQAHAAGGAVHVVLGNHEQYLLRGKVRRTHPEYRYALQQMGGFDAAFAADTMLGAWLRKLPVVLRLGSVLFVHGGVSPQTAQSGLSIVQLNDAMRGYWQARDKKPADGEVMQRSVALDAVLASTGVTQYRGYVYAIESSYPKASKQDVAYALAQFAATQVVVAHTKMDKVTRLFDGLVYAVDVNADEASPEVLMYEHGVPQVLNIGTHRGLETTEVVHKEFSLFDASDRAMLTSLFKETSRLNAKPWPY